ncbi:hypothetical protein TWF225_008170 [Orbilia oligospora]|nr:hypothetical protein TWF225_008170 [Orbilia oligospora]KAF3246424.1 hypothetical protein TWF128_008890 [Orbilia oligospora]KAF3268883.1 hypothetical protein TWF217_010172 [Orbilia oligospora]KAF3292787.1 hypothetical protein TWF132_005157 [Orbilia oligospora]
MVPSEERPIFVATHPRSCSTAFERVFMTREKDLCCLHEPFGDAFYYGPERLSSRYEGDHNDAIDDRENSGFHEATYNSVLEGIERSGKEEKRVFIKDMACYLVPPSDHPTFDKAVLASSVTPSATYHGNGVSTPVKNPTVLPLSILKRFQFAFLIRNPRKAVPSYYRCCIPPLNEMTGFKYFMPNEAGYRELRVLFEYLLKEKVIKHPSSQAANGETNGEHSVYNNVCVIDADDLLDNPKGIIEKFCEMTGLEFDEKMLEWGAHEGCENFDKWKGFHEDAIGSSGLRPRTKKKFRTREEEMQEWLEKYGEEAAAVIDRTADENMEDYEFLRRFRVVV